MFLLEKSQGMDHINLFKILSVNFSFPVTFLLKIHRSMTYNHRILEKKWGPIGPPFCMI